MRKILKIGLYALVVIAVIIVFVIGGVASRIGWNIYQTNKDFFDGGKKTPIVWTAPEENSFYAGVAQEIITPYKESYLAGFDPRRSTGIHDDLYAKALMLEDANGIKIAIVTLDLLGFLRPDVLQIQNEIQRQGITFAQNVLITSTHTHSAPDAIGYFGDIDPEKGKLTSGRDANYMRFVAHQIVEVIEEANNHREPVDLYMSTADACSLCENTRFPEIIDNEVRALFIAYKSGRIAGTIVNFGCHPEILDEGNTLITSDWPGCLYNELEYRFGGKTFFINGALGGMVTPSHQGSYELAHAFGNELAFRVTKSFDKKIKITEPKISFIHKEVAIPLENEDFKFAILLGVIPNATLRNDSVITEVNYLQLGELNIITVPGEITPQIGLAIKQKLQEPKMVWSLTNDELGYIIQQEDWSHKKYKYERTMSLGEQTGQKIMEAIDILLQHK
ncbi:MAG: neutral/alkaline non-lysosomal ceramidase N-terminal domain-containing protein [Parcubacteria group bacterium]|nr:neutral/alkaline non-lysosomal ceramidase N-terminal domain-containing protein [Parcubacteria group bacterium]